MAVRITRDNSQPYLIVAHEHSPQLHRARLCPSVSILQYALQYPFAERSNGEPLVDGSDARAAVGRLRTRQFDEACATRPVRQFVRPSWTRQTRAPQPS